MLYFVNLLAVVFDSARRASHLFVCAYVYLQYFLCFLLLFANENTNDSSYKIGFRLQEFVQGLSILIRGSVQEKLCWTFSLYDLNRDGFITRDEMTDIVTAVYELMGRPPDAAGPETAKIKAKVEAMFTVIFYIYLLFSFRFLPFNSNDMPMVRKIK